VTEIIESRMLEGQLDECPLTLADLGLIRESFTATLRSMLHKRVSYTKAEGTGGGGEDKAKAGAAPRPAGGRTTRFEVIRGGGSAA